MPLTRRGINAATAAMSDLLTHFAADCVQAGVNPRAALRAGGVDPSLWKKWEDRRISPTLRNFELARSGLEQLKADHDRGELSLSNVSASLASAERP